jgi:hypothetical protein
MDALLKETAAIRQYRNKCIAHTDGGRMKISLSFEDIENAINVIEKFILKYNLLLRQAITDTSLGYLDWGWEDMFTAQVSVPTSPTSP